MDVHENQLSAFCGLWEDYPTHTYRMRFCIEMGRLIGYSYGHQSKAFATYDGHKINNYDYCPSKRNNAPSRSSSGLSRLE